MEIRLVALPSRQASVLASRLAIKHSAFGRHYFVVDGKAFYPHITLFRGTISKDSLPFVYKFLSGLAKKAEPIKLKTAEYEFVRGYLTLAVAPLKKIKQLRQGVYESLRPLVTPHNGRMKRVYRPHITLTRFLNPRDARKAVKGNVRPRFTVPVIAIGVTLSDHHGQVYKILKQFRLSK